MCTTQFSYDVYIVYIFQHPPIFQNALKGETFFQIKIKNCPKNRNAQNIGSGGKLRGHLIEIAIVKSKKFGNAQIEHQSLLYSTWKAELRNKTEKVLNFRRSDFQLATRSCSPIC